MDDVNPIQTAAGMTVTDKAPSDDKKTIEEKAKQERGKLDELAQIDTKPILMVKGVFPFDFFPTIVVADRKKITISDKLFFFTRFTHSLLIEDLMSVQTQTGLFFSSLNIVDKHFPGDTITIKFLPTKAALQARKVIDGLIIAQKEKIDLTYIPAEELLVKLEEIGTIN